MGLPDKKTSEIEIIGYLQERNTEIHNTILENGDYMSLVQKMVTENISTHCINSLTAKTALYLSKMRYYANTRDVTYEFLHILNDEEHNNEFEQALNDIDTELAGIQENIINYCNGDSFIPTPETKYLDEVWNTDIFKYDNTMGYRKNFKALKDMVMRLEKLFLNTTHCMYLPVFCLNEKERHILKDTDDVEEVEKLLRKIIQEWGTVNSKASIHAKNRIITATAERGSKFNMNYHLETMGIYRKQYYRFLTNEEYTVPNWKTVFGMGLYFVPYDCEELNNFMNVFGYSLNSKLPMITHGSTVIEASTIQDYMNAGIDTDIIRFLIEQKTEPTKKYSTKTFS